MCLKQKTLIRLLLLGTITTLSFLAWSQREIALAAWQNRQEEQSRWAEIQAQTDLLANSPKDAEAWFNRGVLHCHVEAYLPARNDFEQALKLEPNDPETIYNLAWVQLRLKKNSEALKNLNHLLQVEPFHLDGRWNRAWLYQKLKNKQAAQADYTFLEKHLATKMAPMDRAQLALVQQKPAQAAQAYAQALKKEPQNTRALLGRARSFMAMKQTEAAQKDLNQALALKNTPEQQAELFHLRAQVNEQTNKPEAALADYSQALQSNPSQILFRARAELYLAQKKIPEALADFQNALKLDAKNAHLELKIARLQASLGKNAEAIAYLKQALEHQPQLQPEALNSREFSRLRSDPLFQALLKK
jgi:tetratricopeptide (TPR) repeat protein